MGSWRVLTFVINFECEARKPFGMNKTLGSDKFDEFIKLRINYQNNYK